MAGRKRGDAKPGAIGGYQTVMIRLRDPVRGRLAKMAGRHGLDVSTYVEVLCSVIAHDDLDAAILDEPVDTISDRLGLFNNYK